MGDLPRYSTVMAPADPSLQVAEENYRRLLTEYGDALKGNVDASALFDDAARAWRKVLAIAPWRDEPHVRDMHLVLTMSLAIEAQAKGEVRRVYELMTDGDRAHVDAMETSEPGTFKIWLLP